jgi:hypothetical protein
LSVSPDRKQNKKIMCLAEICRSRREAQIVSGAWGLLDPVDSKKTLYACLSDLGEGRSRQKDRIVKVKPYLEKYSGVRSYKLAK